MNNEVNALGGRKARLPQEALQGFRRAPGGDITEEELSQFLETEPVKFGLLIQGFFPGDCCELQLRKIRTSIYGNAADVVRKHTDLLFHNGFLGTKDGMGDAVVQQVTHHTTPLCAKINLYGAADREFENACAVLGYTPSVIEVSGTGSHVIGPDFHCNIPDSVVPTVLPVLGKVVVQASVAEPPKTTALRRTALITPRYSMSLNDVIFDTQCREDFAPGMVSTTALCNIALCMTSAIKAFNQMGYCHGDIKPGNIMLGPNNTLVLIDYGSACKYGAQIPATSAYSLNARTVGSLHFDLMSLGTVLCELLTAYPIVDKLRTQRDVLNALQEPCFASHVLAPVILLMFTSNNIDEVWRAVTTAAERAGVNPLHLADLHAIWKW